MDIARISGIVENISPILDFSSSGETLFLIIKSCEINNINEHGNEPFSAIYVALSKGYVYWKEKLTVGNSYIFNGHFIYCKDEVEGTVWYYTGNNCSFTSNAPDKQLLLNKPVNLSERGCLKDVLIPVDSILYDKAYVSLYEPSSISLKGFYETTEMNITGKVYQFHKSGWVELVTYDTNKPIICLDKKYPLMKSTMGLGLYMTSSQNNIFMKLNKFTTINAYSVYPMYLWGRLYGFAATVRTHITTHKLSDCDEPEMREKKPRIISLNLASEIGDRCLMFAMWRSYAVKKIFHGISSTTNDNETNNLFENMVALCSDKGKTLYDITKRPVVTIIKEFSNPSYTELYTIRAGYDSDLLCSKMPRIWTTSDICELVARKFSTCTCDVDEDIDYNYCLKLLVGPTGSDREGMCKWSNSFQLPVNEVVIGTVECVELLNNGCIFAIVSIMDLREGKLRVLISNYNSDEADQHAFNLIQQLAHLARDQEACYNLTILIRNPLFLAEMHNHVITNLDIKALFCDVRIIVPPDSLLTPSKFENKNILKYSTDIKNWNLPESPVESVRFLLSKCSNNLNNTDCISFNAMVIFKSMIIGAEKQYSMILRDINNADIITVYISSKNNYVNSITIGMYVRLSNCQLCISQNRKFVYVKSSDHKEMILEIIGFIENYEHLRQLASCRYRPSKLSIISDNNSGRYTPFPQFPPICKVSMLYKSRKYNRCLWKLIGCITFIKSVSVSLKCVNKPCMQKKISGERGNFFCSTCASNKTLKTLWEAHVTFDDGSGECHLLMEGIVVTDMLQLLCNNEIIAKTSKSYHKYHFTDIKKCIDCCVLLNGDIQYKNFEEKNTAPVSNTRIESDFQILSNSIADVTECRNMLSSFVRYHCTAVPLVEITGQLIFKNSTEEFSSGTRNLSLQEVNTAKPYVATTSQFFTLSVKHILVDVFVITKVTGDTLVDSIVKQLHCLN